MCWGWLGSSSLFHLIKKLGFSYLMFRDVPMQKKSCNFLSEPGICPSQSSTDIKLIYTLKRNRDYLRSFIKKKRWKCKNRSSQKKGWKRGKDLRRHDVSYGFFSFVQARSFKDFGVSLCFVFFYSGKRSDRGQKSW